MEVFRNCIFVTVPFSHWSPIIRSFSHWLPRKIIRKKFSELSVLHRAKARSMKRALRRRRSQEEDLGSGAGSMERGRSGKMSREHERDEQEQEQGA